MKQVFQYLRKSNDNGILIAWIPQLGDLCNILSVGGKTYEISLVSNLMIMLKMEATGGNEK